MSMQSQKGFPLWLCRRVVHHHNPALAVLWAGHRFWDLHEPSAPAAATLQAPVVVVVASSWPVVAAGFAGNAVCWVSVLGGVRHLMLVLVQARCGVARVAGEMKHSVSHRLCHPGVSHSGGQVMEMTGAKYVLWVFKIPVDRSENVFHKMNCDVPGLAVAGVTGSVCRIFLTCSWVGIFLLRWKIRLVLSPLQLEAPNFPNSFMKDQKSSQSHDRRLILSLPVCLFVTPTSQHTSRSMCAALVVFVWLVRPVRLPCILLSTTSQKHHFILWLCVCHPRILNDECGRGTVRLSPPSWCSGLTSPPVSLLFLSP